MDKDNKKDTPETSATLANEAEQNSSSDAQESPKASSSRLKGVFYIVVLIAIIVLAAWIYLKQPYKQLPFWPEPESASQASEPTIEYARQSSLAQTQQRLEQLQADLQQAQRQIQQNADDSQQNQLRQRLQQLEGELNQQQQTVQQLASQLPQQQAQRIREWRLFEVKQTLAAAARSAVFNADTQTAIRLLDIANQQLAGIESSGALQIRQAIEEDKQALLDYQQSDATQWVVELATAKRQAIALANKTPTRNLSVEPTQASEPTTWREHLAYNWRAFMDNFFRVQRSTEAVEPVLARETLVLKQQQLDLILSVAENAALKGQVELAKTKLSEATALIKEIKADGSKQQRVIRKLEELNSNIRQAAELPEVSSLAIAASQLGGRLQ
tara:strand:- start:2470 stop:3627 length:1158 start_codon:yes stop_codon:yes gene_type:complete